MNYLQQNIPNIDHTLLIALFSLFISIIALIYTIRAFFLKKGNKVRGWIGFASSIYSNDMYPSTITLENLKDKALVIFNIYLKLGHSYYITIEDFKDNPLIIQPFCVFQKEYDPIIMYSVNMDRIKLDKLLTNKSIKRDLFLSTTDGKIKVLKKIRIWNPIGIFFKNYSTAIIQINRITYNNISYGENIHYLTELSFDDGKKQVIALRKEDYKSKVFVNFKLTEKSLSSKDELLKYFNKLRKKDILKFNTLSIIDFQKEISSYKSDYYSNIIDAKPVNWFQYHIINKVLTNIEQYKMKRRNAQLRKKK